MSTISGIIRILNAFYGKNVGGNTRFIHFVIGVSLIVIAILLYFDFGFSDVILYIILSICLLLQGIDRVMVGLRHRGYPGWVKLTQLVLGIVLVIIGITALAPEIFSIDLSVDVLLLIVVGFFVNGLSRFISGLYGLQDWQKKR